MVNGNLTIVKTSTHFFKSLVNVFFIKIVCDVMRFLSLQFFLLGMNFFVRKMANLAHPTMIIERVSDTQIKIVNKTPLMENSTVYTYGEPTPVKNPNGESLVSYLFIENYS